MVRSSILSALHGALAATPDVEAAWVAGAEAFGRTDELSDIDIIAVVTETAVDRVFDAVEAALAGLGGIAAIWRVPSAATSDYAQRFYRLRGTPEHLMIDLVLLRPDRIERWLDPVRHGVPCVLFDRGGRIRPMEDIRIAATFAERLANLRNRTALIGHLPAKQLARGKVIEAHDFWQRLLLAPLVEVLRARYAPRRQDFGLRYLDLDLPREIYARLSSLLLISDEIQLGRAIEATRAWLDQELAALPR